MPYEVGMAYYREVARGQIRGDTTGRLKLIFHRETRKVLGVHIIGEGASEAGAHRPGGDDAGRHGGLFCRRLFSTIRRWRSATRTAAFNGLGRLSRYQAG